MSTRRPARPSLCLHDALRGGRAIARGATDFDFYGLASELLLHVARQPR